MRVESTDGKHQDIGLFLDPPTAIKVLEKVRSLQPYKPWQFKTSGFASAAASSCQSPAVTFANVLAAYKYVVGLTDFAQLTSCLAVRSIAF